MVQLSMTGAEIARVLEEVALPSTLALSRGKR
jgi:hypothetical protein